MSRYSKEEYKQLLTEFCDYKKYTKEQRSRSLLKPCVYEKDLLNDDETEQNLTQILADLVVRELCANSRNYQYIIEQRNYLAGFYDWCINEKKIFGWQPFDLNLLAPKILLHSMSETMSLAVFDEEMIESLCDRFHDNKALYELLVRGFYEGIPSVVKLLGIAVSDIDFENSTIRIDGISRHFSGKYMRVVREYLAEKEFVIVMQGRKPVRKPMVSLDGRLMKKVCIRTGDTSEEVWEFNNMKKAISMYMANISKLAGAKVNSEILYKSGFIQYVYNRCGRDKTILLDLFIGVVDERSNKKVGRILEQYAGEYGLLKTSKKIRNDYSLFVLKSKFYQQ